MVLSVAACKLQAASRLQWSLPLDNSAAGDRLYIPIDHATGGPALMVLLAWANDRSRIW